MIHQLVTLIMFMFHVFLLCSEMPMKSIFHIASAKITRKHVKDPLKSVTPFLFAKFKHTRFKRIT